MVTKKVKNSQKSKRTKKKTQVAEIELGKDVPASVISVNRTVELGLDFTDPKALDSYYATIPEITRAVDIRGAALISRGFEVKPRDESQDAKDFASLCLRIVNNSGGVAFVEQWQMNADLYGNGYVELVDDGNKVTKLAHVHPFGFGYELETYIDAENNKRTRVKLDKDTQEPVGFATYKFNSFDNIFENDKLIPLEKIAHLKYKVIGDALYGIPISLPAQGSIVRKLKIESYTEDAARLVAAPKIVISGNYPSDEDARREAKEAASLDVSDVVILDKSDDDSKNFEIINPGQVNLPQLREMFIVNITTATGIPRPILTSEGNDINKATMQELTTFLRDSLRSNMNKIKALFENQIFKIIGESYNISNFETLVPYFVFPEDPETEEEIITREEKKAATLTSLSNSLVMFSNMLESATDTTAKKALQESMIKTLELYDNTVKTFMVNNDQQPELIEEDTVESMDLSLEPGMYSHYTSNDEIDTIKQPTELQKQHFLVHEAFEKLKNGEAIIDQLTYDSIDMMELFEKHRYYVDKMIEIGINHEMLDVGSELDEQYYKYTNR